MYFTAQGGGVSTIFKAPLGCLAWQVVRSESPGGDPLQYEAGKQSGSEEPELDRCEEPVQDAEREVLGIFVPTRVQGRTTAQDLARQNRKGKPSN